MISAQGYEIHLFIIWEKARSEEERILADMKKHFEIIDSYVIRWPKSRFSYNLTRFYGQNLPAKSDKIKVCGDGDFRIVIVKDNHPLYRVRKTTKGTQCVNVNIFDAKELYRSWTGGRHRVHATNSIDEVNHDLTLLTGYNSTDYYLKSISHDFDFICEKQLIGNDGFNSIDELLYIMNNCFRYVILRNYENLPDNILLGEHSDLDILCDNFEQARIVLGGVKDQPEDYRVRVKVLINNSPLFVDLRSVGDNYYDYKWEQNILENRVLEKSLFYVPSNTNHLYSLMYHAVVHKSYLSQDYIKCFCNSYGIDDYDSISRTFLINQLKDYMESHKYEVVEPRDLSVLFNALDLGVPESKQRKKQIKKARLLRVLCNPHLIFSHIKKG